MEVSRNHVKTEARVTTIYLVDGRTQILSDQKNPPREQYSGKESLWILNTEDTQSG